MPKVSIIMSVYNGEKFLKESVDSILGQTFKDFEFIIIDDGSKDSSKSIIESYSDPRINLISRENKGLTPSLNEGLKLARGKYIARMDADDVATPWRLEKQVEFLDSNPEIGLCGSWAIIINEEGEKIGEYKLPTTKKRLKRVMFWHNPFIHPSIMFRKEIIQLVGFYNEKIKYAQDYEYWSRIIRIFPGANLPEFLMKYRIVKKSMTRKSNLPMRWEGVKIRMKYLFNL